MPYREGHHALYRLCDPVSGATWRPTRFEDEFALSLYACHVCHVIPSSTVLLPCSHSLCEQCVMGCGVQVGGNVCLLDTKPFCQEDSQKIKLPDKKKKSLMAHCWNEANGCQLMGTIEAVLQHFDRECAFHALKCPRCERTLLRMDIAAHYVAGCHRGASYGSAVQLNQQDSSSISYEKSIPEKLSPLQRQVYGLSRTSDPARFNDICHTVRAFESRCLRAMKDVELNVASMLTQQLKIGLEEVKILVRDPLSDQFSCLQSQVNEIFEHSRPHDASAVQEVVREIRDAQSELKRDVQATSQLMGSMLSDSADKFKKSLTAKLQELVQALKAREFEMKEGVSKVEANLCSKITEQQQSLKGALDSHKDISTETETPVAVPALGRGEVPLNLQEGLFLLKLELFAHETLKMVEFLRQDVHR
ncbi:uncharacterized protein LOC119164960 [Rhipicephalus microplus]|uniref:uncharacterized protein LOC119164960 n=1 Tax=Rhipicephalus microplus TaxID=6941 RepID=UPI003F6AB2E0